MASSEEAVLLKSSVEHHARSYVICLTKSEIYWEAVSSSWPSSASNGPYSQPLVKTENQSVKIAEILAVRPEKPHPSHSRKDGQFQNLEMVSMQSASFALHVMRRQHRHKWRERKIVFTCKDVASCQQWIDTIQDVLSKPELKRPKRLLIFVNPYGGKRKGPKIYREKVAPLLDLASVSTEVVVTQRQNHARDTLLKYDFTSIDGVVCVGGDGMFSELLHGVLTQTQRSAGVDVISLATQLHRPHIRLGVIPAGSTDALAFSVHGTNDPVTATLHIITGCSVGLDISTVHHGNQFLRYQLSLLGYGYFGDVIADSESNRWMGPVRYDWSGFKKVMSHRAYEGEISFIPSASSEHHHPRDGTHCMAGCRVCQMPDTSESSEEAAQWQKVRGRFLAINCFTISCRCEKSPEGASPATHLGDGHMDMVLVSEASRVDYVKYLYRVTDKKADQFDFPFVKVYRVKRFQFQPVVEEADEAEEIHDGQQRLRRRPAHNSVWNCDGEMLHEPSIDVRMHRQMIQVFGRGIEDTEKSRSSVCTNCTCVQH